MERRPDLGTPRPDDLDFRDDPAMRERVPAYMNEALRREFAQSGYRLLTDPAPRAMRLRAARPRCATPTPMNCRSRRWAP